MQPDEPIRDDELEAFLDGTLDSAARERLVQEMQSDPDAKRQIEVQEKLDAAMRRIFAAPATPDLRARLSGPRPLREAGGTSLRPAQPTAWTKLKPSRRTFSVLALGVAVALAWLLVTWQLLRSPGPQPVFARRPLVEVYRETVRAGFQPYYDCRDPARFADVFRQRQGIPLRLAELSGNSRMLGLSYPGGLSPNTTAMLCDVDQQAVMIFVDRLKDDAPIAAENEMGSDLHVFRRELDGLVIYEVSPAQSAHMLNSLQKLD